ncbi:MAG: tetratricopeptide repeat protein [Acidobacteriota bacterium]|jgi:tetratricopeptide (TPR) repeat protein
MIPRLALVLVATLAGALPAEAQLRGAVIAARSGRYDAAIAAFEDWSTENPDAPAGHRYWAKTLLEIGRYDEAERVAHRLVDGGSPELLNVLGEALAARGKLDEADDAFSRAIAAEAADALVAQVNRGQLRERRGDPRAEADYEALIDAYNARTGLAAEELLAVGVACRQLGPSDPQLYKDALRAFDEAIAADPGDPAPRVARGALYLEKYDSVAARDALKTVLEMNPSHPGALLAMAQTMDFDGDQGALALARRALEVAPSRVETRVWVAEALLELESYDEAIAEAERALETDPSSLEALSVAAGGRYLQGDEAAFGALRDHVLALNPRHADLYSTLAELCVRNRLYEEAVGFAREAVRLDPRSWRGHGTLGVNLLRLGDIEAGRASLETSFAGDPYNVWTKNTLDLLDTFDRYETKRVGRLELFVREEEAALLEPYVAQVADEALEALEGRYGYRVTGPVRIEVFPSHADFSVRTVGLAGLGALGVCFGRVVAIDSPSARPRGEFNWASTLWHELAHSVTLGVSDHRVPRWLTEGISVYEERRARPGWGDDVNLDFIAAFEREALLPIESLNDGFVRPEGPEQVARSYYQASLVVELIERDYGFEAVRGLLRGYRDRRSTEELFQSLLGLDLDEFDARFQAFVRERFGHAVEAVDVPEGPARRRHRDEVVKGADEDPGDFLAQLAAGKALLENRQPEKARPYLERAHELFPEYAEGDSPSWLLAQLALEDGDLETAREHLEAFLAFNETHYDAHLRLASVAEELGDPAAAARWLERALCIDPSEAAVHLRLAELYESLGDTGGVVRARRSVLDLDPVDRPEALYQLARAHWGAGDAAAARRVVLEALELAPRFRRAQALLLELHRARNATEGES